MRPPSFPTARFQRRSLHSVLPRSSRPPRSEPKLLSTSELESQTVVSDKRAFRKLRFGRLRQLMADVGEKGFARSHSPGYFQRLIDTQMGWMRLMPERI